MASQTFSYGGVAQEFVTKHATHTKKVEENELEKLLFMTAKRSLMTFFVKDFY